MDKIAIPINSEIVGELFLRSGPETDVSGWVEDVLTDYLARTESDDGWREDYYNYIERQRGNEEYGNPAGGYQWKQLFLPNGTQVYMSFNQKKHYAFVKHGQFCFEGRTDSPSQFANSVAGHSRNAWRDLFIKRSKDNKWILADRLRK
jgi:hypothetical protein